MIVDAILTILLAPVNWVLDAVPTISWPSWFQQSGSDSVVAHMGQWGAHVYSLSSWFPVSQFFDALGFVFVALAAALAIRTVKLVVSYLTGGGGAT